MRGFPDLLAWRITPYNGQNGLGKEEVTSSNLVSSSMKNLVGTCLRGFYLIVSVSKLATKLRGK